ncbi:hypothetical protein BFW01_g1674 [Lasiodiplodia theobromae]|nr:hypothetical protein BFW01_g1674 [Lasiodiplodia theobromae]
MGVFAIGCGSLINWMLLYQHAAHDRRHVSHRTTTVVAWPTLTDDYNDKSKKAGAILGVSSSEANKPMPPSLALTGWRKAGIVAVAALLYAKRDFKRKRITGALA